MESSCVSEPPGRLGLHTVRSCTISPDSCIHMGRGMNRSELSIAMAGLLTLLVCSLTGCGTIANLDGTENLASRKFSQYNDLPTHSAESATTLPSSLDRTSR